MVVPLGPGKFYGKSLPRPRIYTDVKFADERVDPPTPVMDPLLSWAADAHWSMGGLSFKRLRLQGRIEGSVSKLRAARERKDFAGGDDVKAGVSAPRAESDSPPPAPVATKRRRVMDLIPDEEDEEEEEVEEERKGRVRRRRLVKKLGDDFDRVAAESGEKAGRSSPAEGGSRKTRRQVVENEEEEEAVVEKVNKVKPKVKTVKSESGSGAGRPRSSPRFAQRA